MHAWLYFSDEESVAYETAVVDALAAEGIVAGRRDCDGEHLPGCICFSRIDADLLSCVASLSDCGRLNVMVLALAGVRRNDWLLLNAGAADALRWDASQSWARAIAARLARWRELDELMALPWVQRSLVGESRVWRKTVKSLIEVGRFTRSNVLVLGQSGTGKELAARLVHEIDARSDKGELVILDCTTIVPELSGSEFFGHERGAFTGALAAREGAIARAAGGTLFLDEIGELPLTLQAQLLRAVQEHSYKRVGGNTWYEANFRLVCATNRDLRESVRAGTFRHDLYHRIANWTFTLPPLSERIGDIGLLTRHFLDNETSGNAPPLDEGVLAYLVQRDYSGNVRELKHLTARLLHRHVGDGPISMGDIPEDERPPLSNDALPFWDVSALESGVVRALHAGAGLKEISRAAEDCAIRLALRDCDGSLQRAAKRLGVTDRALQLRRAATRAEIDTNETCMPAMPRRTRTPSRITAPDSASASVTDPGGGRSA